MDNGKYLGSRKMKLGNSIKNYPNKSVAYVDPNTKTLKKWLIIENFHFFSMKFCQFFLDMDNGETRRTAQHIAFEVAQKAAKIKTLDS